MLRVRILMNRPGATDSSPDALASREIMRAIFGELGCHVTESEHGRQQDGAGEDCDVFLVDMREMASEPMRVLRELRARQRRAHVIALTRKAERTLRIQNMMQAGFEMVIPYDTGQIKSWITMLVRDLERQRRRARSQGNAPRPSDTERGGTDAGDSSNPRPPRPDAPF